MKVRKDRTLSPEALKVQHRLNAVWYCQRRINRNNERLKRLRSKAEKTTASFSRVPGHGSGHGDRVGEYSTLMADIEKSILEDSHEMWSVIKSTEIIIGSLDDYHDRLILEYRYIDCMPFYDIALRVNYSYRQTLRHHDEALEKLVTLCHFDM